MVRRLSMAAIVVLGMLELLSAQGSPNVQLVGTFNQYSFVGYNDCWGYTAPDGKEYALLGVRSGTSIIEITDQGTLREVVFIPNPGGNSAWKDIKTYRNYAYVVNELEGGLQIINLAQLPVTATLAATYTGFPTSHNIYIDTARALLYAEGTSSQPVRILSLANPTSPVQVSFFGPPSQSIHDVYARGDRAYVSDGTGPLGTSYSIYNVSNPAAPTLLKQFFVPNGGYAHNAWLSDDGNYLMTTEETVGKTVKVWNISDLNAMQMQGEYLAASGLAHNTHIKGNYAYISHYKDGLRIIDISIPSNPIEAGYYNTYIGNISGIFHGAWGAYPFFHSGRVLISDMESGLTVVHFAGAVVTDVPGDESLPPGFTLQQNYPNPFNPSTTISFTLPKEEFVSLKVMNILGQEIAVLVEGLRPAGAQSVAFDARDLPSGVYLYRLAAGSFSAMKRMIVLK